MFNAIRQVSRSAALTRAAGRPATFASPLRTIPTVRTIVSKYFVHEWQCEFILLTSSRYIAKRYTQDHEAVVFDDSTGVGIVSITDYAQSSLGDVVFVELPTVGSVVQQGGQCALNNYFHLENDVLPQTRLAQSRVLKQLQISLSRS